MRDEFWNSVQFLILTVGACFLMSTFASCDVKRYELSQKVKQEQCK